MLLRLFNDDTLVVNTTGKRAAASQDATPVTEDTPSAVPTETEEEAIKQENLALGQDEQEQTETRETYTKAGDEEDRLNTTV